MIRAVCCLSICFLFSYFIFLWTEDIRECAIYYLFTYICDFSWTFCMCHELNCDDIVMLLLWMIWIVCLSVCVVQEIAS